MSIREEVETLNRELAALADSPDTGLLGRYNFSQRPMPRGLYRKLRRLAGRLLHALGLYPSPYAQQRWQSGLKHAEGTEDAEPLLIWALGEDRETIREACRGFVKSQALGSGVAPVLVTDVADFAFFSRLGWLVEYLPELAGEGESYRERKKRYLAWLYRDALVLPLSAGLAPEAEWEPLLRSHE